MDSVNTFLNEAQISDPWVHLRWQTKRTFPEEVVRYDNIPCAVAGSLYVNLDPIHHRPIDVIEHMNRPLGKQKIN